MEYLRYSTMQYYLSNATSAKTLKQKSEARKIIGRYLMTELSMNKETKVYDPMIPVPSLMTPVRFEKMMAEFANIKIPFEPLGFCKECNYFFEDKWDYYRRKENYVLDFQKSSVNITVDAGKNNTLSFDIPLEVYEHCKNRYTGKQIDRDMGKMFTRYTSLFANNLMLTPDKEWKRKQNFEIELFGAPFNTIAPKFGSLYTDIDQHFGAIGDYQSILEKVNITGNVLVNPPFVEEIMNDVAKKIIKRKDRNKFVVIFPAWEDNEGYMLLNNICPAKTLVDFEDGLEAKNISIPARIFDLRSC